MTKHKTLTPGLLKAISACGDSIPELAKRLEISEQAVYRWKDVPLRRVIEVEAATGVAREHLRPDLFKHGLQTGRKRSAAQAAKAEVNCS